jgi:glycosyltransferase involved in cell wall biosynthesis
MITFYHNNSKITQIVSTETHAVLDVINRNITTVLLDFADKYPNEILVWCHESAKDYLNVDAIESLFHHKKILCSYHPSSNYFDSRLGYIEASAFVKVNKEVHYGTWQTSSLVGAVHSSVLRACKADLLIEKDFDYFLNSFAKRAIVFGLFCYSEPSLLKNKKNISKVASSNLFTLFKFTKQHYRVRWIFLLFFNLMVFEKRFPVFPLLVSLFYKRRKFNPDKLNTIGIASNKSIIEKGTIDVLIPTIGRKDYLLNVLENLASQTHLPTNVIVIEQNPQENSITQLDFIQNRKWPFTIKHHFTHQTGACNARNLGLEIIESEFCFFADDDIVFDSNLLENAFKSIQSTGNEVVLISCHLKSQTIQPMAPIQFPVFGGGHSFVKSACLNGLKFNMSYEFGFGEDGDFGMQLVNKGYDILFISTSEIIHLKAPIGGFRTKPTLEWSHDIIEPKPSPTVMLYKLLHETEEQLRSYKTTVFFKNLNKGFVRNPFKYIKTFRQKWNRSVYWANKLKKHQS